MEEKVGAEEEWRVCMLDAGGEEAESSLVYLPLEGCRHALRKSLWCFDMLCLDPACRINSND